MSNQIPRTDVSSASLPLVVGIDLGGTNIKFGLLDDEGRTLAALNIRTESDRGPREAMGRVTEALRLMAAELGVDFGQISCVGLATPGPMDIPAGKLLEPPNLPDSWDHFPIRDCLAEMIGKPVIYENDANAAAFGEYWVGSGRDYASIVLLTLGTGVGAGIIIDDIPLDGQHSHGGECGHLLLDPAPDARMCGCGRRGHLEAYCSATALVKRAHEELQRGRTSKISETGVADKGFTAKCIAEAAAAGDILAHELIAELATHLGHGMVTIAHTVDPAAIILGGAMNFGGPSTELGSQFLRMVSKTFRELALPFLAEHTQIEFAKLGGDAGYIGAAGVARNRSKI